MITVGYTIFNKVDLIPQIVWGVKNCFNEQDEAIFLFDNCTDSSLEKFSELKKGIKCQVKVITPKEELFEIKANNLILREAENNLILLFQDDIICQDLRIRDKIYNLVKTYGSSLGLAGGRSGFELTGEPSFLYEAKHRVSNWEHKKDQYGKRLLDGKFLERTMLNRGPLLFTKQLLEDVGYLDEMFYPLWGDDMDYCCRAKFNREKKNVVFQCDVFSDLSWGSTRDKNKVYPLISGAKIKHGSLCKRNWRIFISRWGEALDRHYENLVINE